MITSAELAEALKGCSLTLKFIEPVSGSGERRMFEILEVTPPPKKPVVKVESYPLHDDMSIGSVWVGEPQFSISIAKHWLRRETIDGVAMQPTVVSAGEGK